MNITQAQALTIEQLDAMELHQLKEVADVLATSESKKARLKLDQVKIVIEKRIKEAKKAGNIVEAQEVKAVENSIKKPSKKKQADEQEALDLDEQEADEQDEPNPIDTLTIKQVEAMSAKDVKALLKSEFGITTNERNVKNLRQLLLDAIDPQDEQDEQEVDEQEASADENDEQEAHRQLVAQINASNLAELKALAKEYEVKHAKIIKAEALRALIKEELAIDYIEAQEAPKQDKAPKADKALKQDKSADLKALEKQMKDMQKKLAELSKENAQLKADIFPSEVPMSDKFKLVATDFKELQDVQRALIETPYQVYMQVHEGIDNVATTFLVVYMDAQKLILVDKSRQAGSTLDLFTKDMTATTVSIDKRPCPFKFYTKQPNK